MSNTTLLKNKISSQIRHQFPEFVQSEHETFIKFLELYYQFLESSEITISGSNDYIVQETDNVNFIIDSNGDKIVLEDFDIDAQYGSSSKFVQGEEIYGESSFARATVLVDDYDKSSKLYITSQQSFLVNERIRGLQSNAVAVLLTYKGNPVQNIQQFLSYVDVDNTVSDFFTEFKNSFLEFIPTKSSSELSKRNLIKNIRELYTVKGTSNAHKLFFRILFDESSLLLYPRENIFKSSDGQWSSDRIIRVIENGNSDFNNLIGQQIYSVDSLGVKTATAIVATVVKFREGSNLIAQLNLDPDSTIGTFIAEETILGVEPDTNLEISATIKSIVTGADIVNRGFNYEIEEPVTIGTGGNNSALARVSSIGSGSVTDLMIANGGTGYSITDEIVFNTLDTNGKDLLAEISVLGGSFLLEDNTSPDYFSTEDGDSIVLETITSGPIITYLQLESSVSDDYLLNENDDTIVLESGTFGTAGLNVPDEQTEITRIKLISGGIGFTKLPTVSVTSSTGQNASLFAISTAQPGIGHVKEVRISNFGLEYNTPPDLYFNRKVVVKNVTGNFVTKDLLTSHDGEVVSYNSITSILELKTKSTFIKGDTIVSISGSSADVYFSDHSTANSTVGVIGTTIGGYLTDKGKISNNSMRVQDSYYYQDYSYVVRVGQSINEWRDSVKNSIHPAGWNVFGEVSFSTKVSAKIGSKSAISQLASQFSPAILGTIFGRRLGTKNQGTLRPNSNTSVFNYSDVNSNQRDVTLTSFVRLRYRDNRGFHKRLYGNLAQIPKYAFVTAKTNDTDPVSNWIGLNRVVSNKNAIDGEYHTLTQIGNYKINQLCDTSFVLLDDGIYGEGISKIILEDGMEAGFLKDEIFDIPSAAYSTYLNIPPPGEIVVTNPSSIAGFDENTIYYDQSDVSFDEGGTATIGKFDSNINSFDEQSTNTFDEKL